MLSTRNLTKIFFVTIFLFSLSSVYASDNDPTALSKSTGVTQLPREEKIVVSNGEYIRLSDLKSSTTNLSVDFYHPITQLPLIWNEDELKALQKPEVTCLSLDRCSDSYFRILFPLASEEGHTIFPNLKTLYIQRGEVTNELERLASFLQGKKVDKVLLESCCRGTQKIEERTIYSGDEKLIQFVKNMKAAGISFLALRGNEISAEATGEIAKHLPDHLHTIELEQNYFRNEGALNFLQNIQNNETLKVINFCNTGIDHNEDFDKKAHDLLKKTKVQKFITGKNEISFNSEQDLRETYLTNTQKRIIFYKFDYEPRKPENMASGSFYKQYDDKTKLWYYCELVTPENVGYWTIKGGCDVRSVFQEDIESRREEFSDTPMAMDPRDQEISDFMAMGGDCEIKLDDSLKLNTDIKDAYLGAFRGYFYNLKNRENAPTWLAYASPENLDHPPYITGLSPDIQILMTVIVGKHIYSPLGIYKPLSARRKGLAMSLHSKTAMMVREQIAPTVRAVFFKPLLKMADLVKESGVPYTAADAYLSEELEGTLPGIIGDHEHGAMLYIPNTQEKIILGAPMSACWLSKHPYIRGQESGGLPALTIGIEHLANYGKNE